MWKSLRNSVTNLREDDVAAKAPQIRKEQERFEPPKKRTDLKASPGRGSPGRGSYGRGSPGRGGKANRRAVNMTPVNLNQQSLAKSTNSVTSNLSSNQGRQSRTDEFLQQRDSYRQRIMQGKMKATTHDMHIHAAAMLFNCDLDFDLLQLTVKEQLLIDVQAIVSSPFFDISPFYKQFNLDIILQVLSIEETTENKSKKDLINLSKIVVNAMTNKYLYRAKDITSRTWNDICNMLGIFIPKNGFPQHYKKSFLLEFYKKMDEYHGLQSTFVNKHALGHLAFYYGDNKRPIANKAKDFIIPPFYTDVSFSLDARRNLLTTDHPEYTNPGNPMRRACGTIGWCGAGAMCQVDLWPATESHKCSKCHQNVHAQCAVYYSATFTCPRCKPVHLRNHWTQRKKTYMLLPHIEEPKAEATPTPIPTNPTVEITTNKVGNVKIYTDVRIAHSIPRASLEIGIRTWLINSNSSLYYKKLQVENTRVVGWFMWSHRYIKADLLSHVLADEHSIHGFFRFSTIYLGKGEKFGPKEGTKALFFVCEAKDFVDITKELRVLYHQGQTKFPLGIRLRFMPQIQNIDENLLLKMQIFRVQQFDFNVHIKTAGTADIQLLDAAIQGEKPLRNYIMNLTHKTSKGPLFLSVDNQWNDPSRCVFAFVASHEKEAIRMVNTLAAHVLKKNPTRAKACFTPKALELAESFLWDETLKHFMTPEESYYLEMDVWGTDTALMGVDKELVEQAVLAEQNTKLLENMTEKPAARIERLYNGTDACSVGTVASRLHSKRITGNIDSDTDAASAGGDSLSTAATTKSQRKIQASKMALYDANMLQTQRTLIDMTAMLQSLQSRMDGNAPATPPDTSRHITIQDSSAGSNAAPRARSRRSLTDGDAGGGTSTATNLPIEPTEPRRSNSRFRQSRLDNRRFNNNESWGNNILLTPVNSVRIGFRNIHFLPAAVKEDRNAALCDDMKQGHIDIMGVSEVNLGWQYLDYNSQPQSRFRQQFDQSKWICANNRTEHDGVIAQRGGTMLGTVNATSNRVIEMGTDPRNLGRWCWCLLQGQDHMLLVCTVYRSCATRGATTSYSQQKRNLMLSGITACPRSQFWDDLKAELVKWNSLGHHIVVGGDFNENVGDSFTTTFFGNFGMREAIINQWGSPSPNTYVDGTVPIDGIFCTRSLEIKAAGYTSLYFGLLTDHRLLWIDVSLESAFGINSIPFQIAKARKLQLDQPNTVNQYLGQRMHLMSKNQLQERTNALYEKVLAGEKGLPIILELEKLDSIRTSDMLTAEQRCRKIKAGAVAWSPTLQKSIDILRYLRLVISRHRRTGSRINARTLRKAFDNSSLVSEVFTLESAIDLLKAEKVTYKTVKENSEALRKSFLEQLAETKAAETGLEASTVLKQLQQREQQRSLARQLQRIKGSTKRGLSELQVLQDNQWVTVTDKMAIEQECMKEGKQRFEQAQDTACLSSEQIALLGWTANTEAASGLLKGTLPSNLQADIKHIASYLQTSKAVADRPEIVSVMTAEQYVSGWAKAKERTSSGTSGLHFGHFKANSTMYETLDIDVKLLQMSIILGYSLVRWRSAVDVMIPKKADSKKASQLRVICLMEPDFNFMNKWMGKITMSNAEAATSIAPEQFGSRKNKSAIQHAFNKALCFDTLRTMKDDSALTVLDAKSCYDRIPPPLACLCLRRQGLPQNIIDASFNSIKDMTHHIRTAYGISQVSYERDDDSYMHGILQGNGAGPCIWVMLSSPILDMLSDQGNGATLHLPDGQIVKVVAFAFVDDIDLIQKLPKLNPLSALQHDFNIWEKGLRTISGALVWEKCDVYILQNIWDDRLHNWKLADQTYCPGSITVMHEAVMTELRRKEPDEATLSLGVMFAPSGDMKDQVKHLRKKAETWADLLRIKKISPEAVWYSLTASIMKSIEFPLLATTMSQSDLTFIMAPILLSALPRAKICRFFNRNVLYSLPMHQGMGLQNPYYTQGIRKLMEVMHADCSSNPTQKFIQASNVAMELFTGLGPNYLAVPMNKLILKTVPNSILRCLWEFLSEYNITFTSLQEDRKQFPNDEYMMKPIFQSALQPKAVATFNFCRIYLQLETLSEFITIDGKRIQQHVWHGNLLHHRLDSRIWATQPKPSGTAWTSFRKTLQHIFNTNEEGILTTPILVAGWNRRNWKWLYCQHTARLFEATAHNKGFVRSIANTGSSRSRRHANMFWKNSSYQDTIPPDAIPVTVFDNHGFIIVENITPLPTLCMQSVHVRWSDFVRVQRDKDLSSMDQAFLQGHLVLVSDGSYKEGVGSAAWILSSSKTHERFVNGQCATTGPPHAQDSHRSELFGILGGLFFLKSYLSKFNFCQQHSILVGLDNTSAMNYVFDRQRYPIVKSYYPDFDVITAARSLLCEHVTYIATHIPGHQDKFIGPLDFLPTLNVRMDAKCKEFRGKVKSDLSMAIVPNQKFTLKFQGNMICKNVEAVIREGISAIAMGCYWDKHNVVPIEQFPLVSWQAIGLAMKKETPLMQHWIVKHSTGVCGVNEKLVQWKEKDSPLCVRCKLIENAAHVWKCQHSSSSLLWKQALIDLKEWMIHNSTAPAIIEALIQGLKKWYNDDPITQGCILSQAQMAIGWQHVITGKFHVAWQEVQQHHYIKIGRGKKSSLRWLSKLISRIWKIAWDLWDKRNELEHADDQLNRNIEYTRIIEQELAYGFEDLHASCYYFFSEREVAHLRTTANVEYKRNWIALVRAARFVITSASLPIPTIPIAPLPI